MQIVRSIESVLLLTSILQVMSHLLCREQMGKWAVPRYYHTFLCMNEWHVYFVSFWQNMPSLWVTKKLTRPNCLPQTESQAGLDSQAKFQLEMSSLNLSLEKSFSLSNYKLWSSLSSSIIPKDCFQYSPYIVAVPLYRERRDSSTSSCTVLLRQAVFVVFLWFIFWSSPVLGGSPSNLDVEVARGHGCRRRMVGLGELEKTSIFVRLHVHTSAAVYKSSSIPVHHVEEWCNISATAEKNICIQADNI